MERRGTDFTGTWPWLPSCLPPTLTTTALVRHASCCLGSRMLRVQEGRWVEGVGVALWGRFLRHAREVAWGDCGGDPTLEQDKVRL